MILRLTVAAAFLTLWVGLGSTAFAAKPPVTLAGSIVHVAEKFITVHSDAGDKTVMPDADTVVTIDGTKSKWADLKEGVEIKVTFKEGSSSLAQTVQVGAAPDDNTPKKKKKKKASPATKPAIN